MFSVFSSQTPAALVALDDTLGLPDLISPLKPISQVPRLLAKALCMAAKALGLARLEIWRIPQGRYVMKRWAQLDTCLLGSWLLGISYALSYIRHTSYRFSICSRWEGGSLTTSLIITEAGSSGLYV